MNKNTKIIILAGEPGAGKSTLAQKMLKEGKVDLICEADQYMVNERGDYDFSPRKLGYCHKKCQEAAEEGLQKGLRVVVSNTNLYKSSVKHYIDMARQYGAEIEIIHLPSEVNYGSVHNVPAWKVEKMRNEREFFTLEDFN